MIYSLMRLLSDSTIVHSQLSFDDEEELFGQITFVIDLLKYNLVIMIVTVAVVFIPRIHSLEFMYLLQIPN